MKDAVPPVSHQGVLVLMLVMSIGLLALLVVLLLSRGRGGALGLRKFMKGHFPSSNKGSMTEVTPRRPMATVQHKEIHPDSLPPAANHDHTPASSLPGALGPVYIQQPSTVFVSLLNQFKERSPTEEAEEEISSPYQEQGKESHISKEEEY
ncbi:uncharacterized protein si:dkey-260g12.1 [Engraulis encrasicolus]|uniref:uncharacterized protein si:dkey-260g12.1 n=1 Tax=Engraulis encrasicolus TaxID=184585 RepID=UPI002FD1C2EE